MHRQLKALALLAVLGGCAPPGVPEMPRAEGVPIDSLPIAPVTGPLALTVVYPPPDATITAADSTFLLGSVGTAGAHLTIDGQPVDVHPNGAWLAWVSLPRDSAFVLTLEATTTADTVRVALPLGRPSAPGRAALLDSLGRGLLRDTAAVVVELDDDPQRTGRSDSLTIGRNVPGGTYSWFLARGTRAVATGQLADMVRLRVSSGTDAWVPAADVVPLPAGTPPPLAVVGSVEMRREAHATTVRVPLGVRAPVSVAAGEKSLVVTVHGARGDVNWTRYAPRDDLVERVDWRQDADRVVLEVRLRRALWGYRTRWDGTELLVDVRRPPCPDPHDPLRGRSIALDPGHPPAGATGPTGLTEAEANLAVARRLQGFLERAGARVTLTRTDDTPLDLTSRIRAAEAAGAEVLVSIHNNALPDGVNPFSSHGSSVFYQHAPSLPLARAVQAGLVQRLGVRDLGVGRGDLALIRPTWQPSILTEGLFMIVPAHEAALRRPEGQERYALGVYDGLRAFLAAQGVACESPAP